MSKTNKKPSTNAGARKLIVLNKKARHEFFIDETYEAGLVLDGWEVKAMRAGRAQLKEGYILLKDGEAWLFGTHISPLPSASTHVNPDPIRTRKLLLHRRQIDHLVGLVERKGYALVPLSLYFSKGKAKLEIGLGRGKKKYDKRAVEKDRDWKRQKERILKH